MRALSASMLTAVVASGTVAAGGPQVADGGQFGTSGYDGVFAMDADLKARTSPAFGGGSVVRATASSGC
jgi:hypothetical protein